MPEISVSLELMNFAKKFPEAFSNRGNGIAFYVALLKIIGGIMTEVINTFLMIEATSVLDVVKDFIALEIISTIDDMMISTVRTSNFNEEVKNLNLKFKRIPRTDTELVKSYFDKKCPKSKESRVEKAKYIT